MTEYRFFYERLGTDEWTVTFPSHVRHVREFGDCLVVLLGSNRLGHTDEWPVPTERNVVALDANGDREWIVGPVPDAAPSDRQEYRRIERIGDDLWAEVEHGGPRHRIDPATGEVLECVDGFAVPTADGIHRCRRPVHTVRGVGDRTVALVDHAESRKHGRKAICVDADGHRIWERDREERAFSIIERIGDALTLYESSGVGHVGPGGPRVAVDPETGEAWPHAPHIVDGTQWVPTGRALEDHHVHAVRTLGERSFEWSDRSRHGYPYYNFPFESIDGVLAWTGDPSGEPTRIHGLDADGTVRWTREATRPDGTGDRFVAGRSFGGRHVMRDDAGRWHDLDLETGETAMAAQADEIPLPDGPLSLPAEVRQGFEVGGLVVANLDLPQADAEKGDAFDVHDVGSLTVETPRPKHAPEFGPLTADRPILGCTLDGAVRWQVESFHKGGAWPTFSRIPEASAWFRTYYATIDLRSGEVARTGWRR